MTVLLSLLVLASGYGDFRPSKFDVLVGPYKYSLVRWEISNFPDKWYQRLVDLMPWTSAASRQERVDQAKEYFELGQRLREIARQLASPGAASSGTSSVERSEELRAEESRASELRNEAKVITERRDDIRASVEETIEAEISNVLAQEGFSSRIGLIFPPVDTVFSRSPGVLILSPRDRLQRQETILMKPGLSDETRNLIEEEIFREENLAALVESTGGVAVFPSVVSESGGLHHAVVTATHEWLHHWFFFQPLGQHFWDTSDMTTLNETAATLAGRAIGDRAFTALTGEPVVREIEAAPVPADPDAFDFNAAMRETRLRTEELLFEGKIVEAEAYMEERRQFLESNGHFIRKINQAFFAFHGSYATSSASVSPIKDQLSELESNTGSVEEFVKTVASFGSYQDFLDHLETIPDSDSSVVP